MKKIFVAALVLASIGGCAAKPAVVTAGGMQYSFKEMGKKDEDKDERKRLQQLVDPLFTTPTYVLMFKQAQAADQQASASGSGLNQHHVRAAVLGGALAASPLAGTGLGAANILNLGASLMEAGHQSSYVKMNGQGYYNLATDGSITLAKWYPGTQPHEGAAQAYAEIGRLLSESCGFIQRPDGLKKFGSWRAEIWGRCSAKAYNSAIVADASNRFKAFHQVMGEGTLVTYYFFGYKWSDEERRSLAKALRERVPAGWYVMRAMPIENQATGQMESQYLVSMGGQHKAFPLPPKPQFK